MKPLALVLFARLLTHSPDQPRALLEHRAHAIAHAAEQAEVVTGTKASLILAVGWAESRWDPNNHGKWGRGVWGLNPKQNHYRYARAMCDLDPSRCLTVQATFSGEYLAIERKRCRHIRAALRQYVSGKCKPEGKAKKKADAYVAWVLRIQKLIERESR